MFSVAVQAWVPQIFDILVFSKWVAILEYQTNHTTFNHWFRISKAVVLPFLSWWAWCRRPVLSWVGWPGRHLVSRSQGEGGWWSCVSPTGTCPSALGPCQRWYDRGPMKQCTESCSQSCRFNFRAWSIICETGPYPTILNFKVHKNNDIILFKRYYWSLII